MDIIAKPPLRTGTAGTPPNLSDYDAERRTFTWDAARDLLDGLPDGGLNIAHEAVHRHAAGPRADHVAIRWIGKDDRVVDVTYAALADRVSRFADVLASLGVDRGDRVFALSGRVVDLYVAALGTLHHGAVFCPLFSAFGPEPIRERVGRGDGRVLVTTAALYRRKVAAIRDALPMLEHVLLLDEPDVEGTLHLPTLLQAAAPGRPVAPTRREDMALLHFTSGTTGMPKGAVHVHDAVLAHAVTGRFALDLHPEDVFWCTADPGWVTGTSYGIIAPLVLGVTMVVDEGEFDAARWYRILQDQQITVLYTAPTAVRRLMRAGTDLPGSHDLSSVRFAASVGEPLNPEALHWAEEHLGILLHDNWWQTETGGIMIANIAASEVRPGSMGRPLPGVVAEILAADDDGDPVLVDGAVVVLDEPDRVGALALRRGWPSMMRGYLHEPERYERCFVGDRYISGDLARRDADGWFWFVGRGNDLIKSSGHLIGPFEVESALIEHPSVAEAGVIGVPDPVAGEVVKAFVSLNAGWTAGEDLRRELYGHARSRLGPAVSPKQIEFTDDLPKTRSGKIMRRLLKARELGLAEGDTSTLETPA